jgi:hypothetical protein
MKKFSAKGGAVLRIKVVDKRTFAHKMIVSGQRSAVSGQRSAVSGIMPV